jgi:hypothetical protein
MGLSLPELVALSARMRSAKLQEARIGVNSTYTTDASALSTDYFKVLLAETWVAEGPGYRAKNKELFVTAEDMVLLWDGELLAVLKLAKQTLLHSLAFSFLVLSCRCVLFLSQELTNCFAVFLRSCRASP